MKKMICLVVVVLMIAAVAIAQKKTAITAKDLPALKGTYSGIISFGLSVAEADTSPCTLEILNDTVPVKAKLTIANIKDQVASRLGITGGQKVSEADDGTITSMGTIVWTGPEKNFFEVSSAGAKTLKAYYFFRGLRGEGTLKKK